MGLIKKILNKEKKMKKIMLGLMVLFPLLFAGCSFFYESATIKVVNNTNKDFYWIVDYNGSMRNEKNEAYNTDSGKSYSKTFDCELLKGEIEDRGGDKISFWYCDETKFWEVSNANKIFGQHPSRTWVLKQTDQTGYSVEIKQNDGVISDYYIITINPSGTDSATATITAN